MGVLSLSPQMPMEIALHVMTTAKCVTLLERESVMLDSVMIYTLCLPLKSVSCVVMAVINAPP